MLWNVTKQGHQPYALSYTFEIYYHTLERVTKEFIIEDAIPVQITVLVTPCLGPRKVVRYRSWLSEME